MPALVVLSLAQQPRPLLSLAIMLPLSSHPCTAEGKSRQPGPPASPGVEGQWARPIQVLAEPLGGLQEDGAGEPPLRDPGRVHLLGPGWSLIVSR